jgi:hypothetical protein
MDESHLINGSMEGSTHIHFDDTHVLPPSVVFDAISMKLDFSYGYKVKADIKKRFGTTVRPLGKSNHFLLVVSFGRATFKLNEDVVGIALESCIGGNCDVVCEVPQSQSFFVSLFLLRQWVSWLMH